MKILAALAITTTLTILPSPANAQTLAKASSIKCSFSVMSISSLREEPPKVEVKPSTLVMQFDSINADEGTAQWKSGFGAYDIIVRYAQGYLNFIQSFRDGPVYLTTVLEQKTKAGKLKAMHSRHESFAVALPGITSSPEQYYGECEILS